jgi:hypothetical protein
MFIPKLQMYLKGNGLIANRKRDYYEIEDKIPYILSGSILPEEFIHDNFINNEINLVDKIEIVAIKYYRGATSYTFQLKR